MLDCRLRRKGSDHGWRKIQVKVEHGLEMWWCKAAKTKRHVSKVKQTNKNKNQITIIIIIIIIIIKLNN
jgi:hypothetical protein